MTATEWNIIAGIGDSDPEAFDIAAFAEWGGVLAPAPQGGMQVTLTVPAVSLRQAIATGLTIVEAAGLTPTSLDALTSQAYDRRSIATAPDTVGVPEAARLLGVSANAVRQRIQTGSLPARRVGRDWQIPRPALTEA
jgi:excisionase family DNA binding protein